MKNILLLFLLTTTSLALKAQTFVTVNFPDPCSCDNSVLNELLNIRNVTLPEATDTCFGATQTIVVGEVGAAFIMQPGSSAVMVAGERIVFKPYTHIQAGSHLHAFIAPAGPFCGFQQKHFLQAEKFLVDIGQDISPAELSKQDLLFRIYPNPTTGMLNIEFFDTDQSPASLITVYDVMGNKLEELQLQHAERHTLNLSGLPPGMYIITVTSGAKRGFERVIKL